MIPNTALSGPLLMYYFIMLCRVLKNNASEENDSAYCVEWSTFHELGA